MKNKDKDNDEYADIRAYMALPAKKKLQLLEEAAEFYARFMPEKSKQIWERLKKEGF